MKFIKLETLYDTIPQNIIKIILGDLNTKIEERKF